MARKNPETKFKEKVIEDLKTLTNIWFFKSQEVSVRGIPDLIVCVNGWFLAIELKVDSKVSELQEYNLRKIKEAKGYAVVSTPKTWKNHFQQIKEMTYGLG